MSDPHPIELGLGVPQCPNCFHEIDTLEIEKRAIKATEQRIIKLLDKQMKDLELELAQWSEPALHRYKALEQVAIALIKGETE